MAWDPLRLITVNGLALQNEKVVAIRLNGMLQTESTIDWGWNRNARLFHNFFPSTEQPAAIETYRLVNEGKQTLRVEIPQTELDWHTDAAKAPSTCTRETHWTSRPPSPATSPTNNLSPSMPRRRPSAAVSWWNNSPDS